MSSNPHLISALDKLRPSMSPTMFRRVFTSEECEALREYLEYFRDLLRAWIAGCANPPGWHWSQEIHTRSVKALSGVQSVEPEQKPPSIADGVTSDFLRSILKEAKETGDPEVDRIAITMTTGNARKICEELLLRRRLEEIIEPAAWMADDGRLIGAELKAALTPLSTAAAFTVPLYPTVTVNKPPGKVRDDPNAPFRWICAHCSTVNAITDTRCLGCKRPKEPL